MITLNKSFKKSPIFYFVIVGIYGATKYFIFNEIEIGFLLLFISIWGTLYYSIKSKKMDENYNRLKKFNIYSAFNLLASFGFGICGGYQYLVKKNMNAGNILIIIALIGIITFLISYIVKLIKYQDVSK